MFLLSLFFVGLDAQLVAILQLIVYAGAIVVLFLFIIMLLNLQAQDRAMGARRSSRRRSPAAACSRPRRHRRSRAATRGRRRAGPASARRRRSPSALHAYLVPVRADVDPPPRRDRRRDRARRGRSAMPTPLSWYLGLSAVLFAIGVAGVLVRRNVIVIFMAIELMLNAVNLTFVALARSLGSIGGQVVVFFVMTVAAAEAAVGLAIILAMIPQPRDDERDELATLDGDRDALLRWIIAHPALGVLFNVFVGRRATGR
jgi:NADH-quinone oxidoreductase subunit K